MGRARQAIAFSLCAAWLGWAAAVASGSDWVNFANETASRLIADAGLGVSDTQEKDYIWGDIDQDGDVDLADFKIFLTVYTGPLDDCQPNGVLDLQDILVGTSSDDNFNGVPDDCCPGDVNGDGVTNVLDLIDLLLCFGQPAVPDCEAEDGNNDGVVNVLDLIDLLLDFGLPCP